MHFMKGISKYGGNWVLQINIVSLTLSNHIHLKLYIHRPPIKENLISKKIKTSFIQIYSSSQQMKHDNMTLSSEININILIGQSSFRSSKQQYERGMAL